MKTTQLTGLLIALFCMLLCVSCEKDDHNQLTPSAAYLLPEAEGGEFDINFNNTDWRIAGVLNKNGDVNICGDAFAANGKVLRTNDALYLDGLGELNALWGDKGFRIVRNDPSSMKIVVEENLTGDAFSFTVVLQSGNETKEILVEQKASLGYRFDKIEYFFKDGDKDLIFTKSELMRWSKYETPTEINVAVYDEVLCMNISYFKCLDVYRAYENALYWIARDSVEVPIPTDVYDGETYSLANESRVYGLITQSRYDGGGKRETITVPAGIIYTYVDFEWRERVVSFKLTLLNNRTGQPKVVYGRWHEKVPTGNYKIRFLPDE